RRRLLDLSLVLDLNVSHVTESWLSGSRKPSGHVQVRLSPTRVLRCDEALRGGSGGSEVSRPLPLHSGSHAFARVDWRSGWFMVLWFSSADSIFIPSVAVHAELSPVLAPDSALPVAPVS